MWSPEGRKQNARELSAVADKVLRYRQLADRFIAYFPPDSDSARSLSQIKTKIEDLRSRCLDRAKRMQKGVVKIGVVGLEKQGKSAFLSAWLRSEKLLPSEAERCTWSTTVVEPAEAERYEATVTFYGADEFKQRIASYFDALEPGSAERWETLDDTEIIRLKATFRAREGFDVDDPDRSGRKEQAALLELQEIAATLAQIKANLGKAPLAIHASSLDELAELIRPYIALKDTKHGNRPYGGVRAVKLVTVSILVAGAMPGVVLVDLPGIDAPSDKARLDTEEALTNEVDITIFVKDVTRPSLVRNEIELLRTAQSADRSIRLKDRMFVVLTKIDLFDHPDENGNWHWQLAARNFSAQGVDRVFPYAKPWVHDGPDLTHPVAKQLMDYFGSTTPVHGLEKLQAAVEHYLNNDVEALDAKVMQAARSEFTELEAQLRGVLVSVKDALGDREFERRAEQQFDVLFEHIRAGEDPVGLLPEVRTRMSAFMDHEVSEPARIARAARADERIRQIRQDLLERLTPAEAEAKRRQMPSPGLMNETAVEIEMRKQMRERVAAKIAGLGEDFRNTARESVERMLHEMFVEASYDGGRLEMLLPGGKSLVERIDALGRAGHVSESVVRYQNNEMAKADVAFEVLSRYFARQIVDILDATDPGDRDMREREMAGLEQFFGMGRPLSEAGEEEGEAEEDAGDKDEDEEKAKGGGSSGMLGAMRSKLGLGATEDKSIGGFPSAKAARGTKAPAAGRGAPTKTSPGEAPAREAPAPAGPPRDWTRMLLRVREDVERICNFLEALAKHPRGLQKYHEEAVRTVHDSWIDREGEQSLRRWVRSECTLVWPHRFAALEAEKARARADIGALEELFGGGGSAPAMNAPGSGG